MGRFYKTSKPEMIDFMYQLPEQAILGAIKSADAQVAAGEQLLSDYLKQLNVQALYPDQAAKDAAIKEIENQIKEHTLVLKDNPVEFLKEQTKIRELGRNLNERLTRGDLAAYQSNYNTRQKFLEEAKKRATDKDGTIRMQEVDAAMKLFDLTYAQNEGAKYNLETGKYNPYGTENLVNYFDAQKFAVDIASKIKTDKDERWTTQKEGSYWFKTLQSSEVLGLNEATANVYSNMLSNDNLMDWYNQQINFEAREYAIRNNVDYNKAEELIRAKYFGERDNQRNLIMEDVLNEDGSVQTVRTEDGKTKNVKKPKNAGLLFETAQNAADLYDFNNTKKGKDLVAQDQFDLEALKQKNKLATLDYEKKLKEGNQFDNKTATVTKQLLNGKTLTEARTALTDKEKRITSTLVEYKANLINLINNSKNLNSTQYTKIKDTIDNYLKGDNPDFAGLSQYLSGSDFAGININGQPIGTGVESLRKEYSKLKVSYNNDKNLLETFEKEAEEKLVKSGRLTGEHSLSNINNVKIRIQDRERKLKESQEFLDKVNKGEINYGFKERIQLQLDIADEIASLQQDNEILSNLVNKRDRELNQEIFVGDGTTNKNKAAYQIFGIGGNIFNTLGGAGSSEENTKFTNALTDLKKQSVWANIQEGSGAVYTDEKGNLKPFSTNAFIGELFFGQDITSKQTDADGNLIVKTRNGEFKFETESVKVNSDPVLGEYNNGKQTGLNNYSYQYVILGTDPETRQKKSYTVHVGIDKIQNNAVNDLLSKYDSDLQYQAFLTEAAAQTSTVNSGKYEDPRTAGLVRYDKGTNMVEFKNSDGTWNPISSGNAKEKYKSYYKGTN